MAPSRSFSIVYGIALATAVEAWLPSSATIRVLPAGRVADARGKAPSRNKIPLFTALKAGKEESGAASSRSDLKTMKQGFERSMDGMLVMDYVKELRDRKRLLLSRLKETGGIITEDVYSIMEELALVNPSSGCGKGSDKGRDHYSVMLLGHWIAVSTIIPTVPFIYGDGEQKQPTRPETGSQPQTSPACTLGQVIEALTDRECLGDFDPSIAVRPLRVRLSALANTVAKEKAMPTVVAVAGFGYDKACFEGSKGTEGTEASSEAGAVRGRGRWVARGENHLRWEFDTMNLDLGGDKIVKTEAVDVTDGQGVVESREGVGGGKWGGRDLYEFFLDQDMFIMAWKGESPRAEDAMVFVRDEVPRR